VGFEERRVMVNARHTDLYNWCIENVLLFGKSKPNCHSKVLFLLVVQ
jgi:hypothetical protein